MKRTGYTLLALTVLPVAAGALLARTDHGHAAMTYAWSKLRGRYTVEDRLAMHATDVEARVKSAFHHAGVVYPPRRLAYVAFKDQRELEVYARNNDTDDWAWVLTYPVLGMSGQLGPKLREGDLQVPEGLYRAEFLNANSRFHLSIRLNYPNADDRAWAAGEGRSQLGSDIMIHGTSSSIGCLAMGNQAAEDLFILSALAGTEHVRIIVAPTDFRREQAEPEVNGPPWLHQLYAKLRVELAHYPMP